jgi:hypothetical protein
VKVHGKVYEGGELVYESTSKSFLPADGSERTWTSSKGVSSPGAFDRTIGLDGVPDGYRAIDERESIKVLVKPS